MDSIYYFHFMSTENVRPWRRIESLLWMLALTMLIECKTGSLKSVKEKIFVFEAFKLIRWIIMRKKKVRRNSWFDFVKSRLLICWPVPQNMLFSGEYEYGGILSKTNRNWLSGREKYILSKYISVLTCFWWQKYFYFSTRQQFLSKINPTYLNNVRKKTDICLLSHENYIVDAVWKEKI